MSELNQDTTLANAGNHENAQAEAKTPVLAMALAMIAGGYAPVMLHALLPNSHCTCGPTCVRSRAKHPVGIGWESRTYTAETFSAAVAAFVQRHGVQPGLGWRMGLQPNGAQFVALDEDAPAVFEAAMRVGLTHLGPLPPTFWKPTPSGGRHRVFQAQDSARIANTVKALPGADVRSAGGQIVIAPSVGPKGAYANFEGAHYAQLPAAWEAHLIAISAKRARSSDVAESEGPEKRVDNPVIVEHLRAELAKMPTDEPGSKSLTFVAAGLLVRGGCLTHESALELLKEYNARSSKPHPVDYLENKIRNADADSDREWGYALPREWCQSLGISHPLQCPACADVGLPLPAGVEAAPAWDLHEGSLAGAPRDVERSLSNWRNAQRGGGQHNPPVKDSKAVIKWLVKERGVTPEAIAAAFDAESGAFAASLASRTVVSVDAGAIVVANNLTQTLAAAVAPHLFAGLQVRHYRTDLFHFDGSRYSLKDRLDTEVALRTVLQRVRIPGKDALVPLDVTRKLVDEVMAAITALPDVHVTGGAPRWLGEHKATLDNVIVFKNGWLDIATSELHGPDPELFAVGGCDFDYVPDAPKPERWHKLLEWQWPGESGKQAQMLLQEWFGYCLSQSTRLQKFMLLVGHGSGGKGTILRIMAKLIGDEYVASGAFSKLGKDFGLARLIGKTNLQLPDVRDWNPSIAAIEALMSIVGEDDVSVNRKHRDEVDARLNTRITIASNCLPMWQDSGNGLLRRILVLPFEHHVQGQEDPKLEETLSAELPGIMRWALDGYRRLMTQGRFTEPKSTEGLRQKIRDAFDTLGLWLNEAATADGAGHVQLPENAHTTYRAWCEQEGYRPVADFAQTLKARGWASYQAKPAGDKDRPQRRWRRASAP